VRPLLGVHPNVISLFALVAGCLAGVSFWLAHRSELFFLTAAVLMAVSGLADAVDGIVAREAGRASRFGDFLDHFFDRLVEVAILGGLAVAPGATTWLGMAVLLLVLLNSYLGTQIHASFGSRDYTGLGKAQLFVGLVVMAVFLAWRPDAALAALGGTVSAVDLFLVAAGTMTVVAMTQRLVLAWRLDRPGEPQ